MLTKPASDWSLTLPATVNTAVSDGLEFGMEAADLSREKFELALERRLTLIAQIMGDDEAAEAVIAAFDQAAWGAWEIGRG